MKTLLEHTCEFLKQYGYLAHDAEPDSFEDIDLTAAIAKFQRFDANVRNLKEQTGEPLVEDGIPGGATLLAMQLPRCACVDIEDGVDEAIGDGGWKECLKPGEHGAVVEVDQGGLPGYLKPHLKAVLTNTQKAYAEIGLLFLFRDSDSGKDLLTGDGVSGETQTLMTFTRGSGWIGLALVGPFSCGRQAWLKLDNRYRPRNIVREWTTLVKHELGHNCGLRHTSGGVMNPSIVGGLPTSWQGDPSHARLVRWFGGEPVDVPGGEPEPPEPPDDDRPGVGDLVGQFSLMDMRFEVRRAFG